MSITGYLFAGPDARLESSLLAELAHGLGRMRITCPSRGLEDLPTFVSRTGISELTVGASDPIAAVQADRVLQRCWGVRNLICDCGFMPHRWPPGMTALTLKHADQDEDHDAFAADVRQHIQLVCLQDAMSLQQLELHTEAICSWPDSLHCTLPASLRTVCVFISLSEVVDMCNIDLSAFTLAPGCATHVRVDAMFEPSSQDLEEEYVCEALAAIHPPQSFSSLCLAGLWSRPPRSRFRCWSRCSACS